MAAPHQQIGIPPYSPYGYGYDPSTTAAVAATEYTWPAATAQFPHWQIPQVHQSAPNPLEQEPDALQSRTLFFGRLPDEATEDMLRDLCAQHGDLKKVAVYPEKRMAFVEFFDLRHAETARDALRGTELSGKRVEVQFSAVKRPDKDGNTGTLYVRPVSTVHISGNWTDPNSLESYRELFAKHGDLKKVSANRKRETEKFVEYFDLRDAQKALDSLNGFVFNGATLHICFAQNASRTVNKSVARATGGSRRTPEGFGPLRRARGGAAGSGGGRMYGAGPYASAAPVAAPHPHTVASLYASAPGALNAAQPPPAYVAAVPYAAAAPAAAYGAAAYMPYQSAPAAAYGLYAYQQPQAQAANGFAASPQWAAQVAAAPAAAAATAAAAAAAAAVPYALAPQTVAAAPASPAAAAAAAPTPAPAAAASPQVAAAAPRW